MSTPVIGFLVAIAVIGAIYFLFVVPGERKYHETKLRLMQERIERHQRSRDRSEVQRDTGDAPHEQTD